MEAYIRKRFNKLLADYCASLDLSERAHIWGRMCELNELAVELNLESVTDEINARLDEELAKPVGGDK